MPNDVASRVEPTALIAGEKQRLESDSPLRLDTYDGVFLVRSGYVDLFAVWTEDGEPVGARRHVLRVGSGGIVCGFPAAGNAAVIAVGGLETEIQHLTTLETLTMPTGTEEAPLDGWIAALAEAAFGAAPAWPDLVAQPGQAIDCQEGARVHAGRGVLWTYDASGAFGILDSDESAHEMLPLAAGFFLRARRATSCMTEATGRMPMDALERGLD